MKRLRANGIALLLGLLWLAPPAAAEPSEAPSQVVGRLHDALRSAAPMPSAAERARRLAPSIASTHDLGAMLALRLEGRWTTLSESQRGQLVSAYGSDMAAAYAAETGDTGKGTWSALAERRLADGKTALVTATLVPPGGEPVSVTYRLEQTQGTWRIVDVTADDESTLADERKAFQSALASGGFARLLSAVGGAAGPAEETATQVIARLQTALLDAMRDGPRLGYRGRYEQLEPVVKSTHFLPGIASLALRRHWKTLTRDQQKEFLSVFTDLSTANYAAHFDKASGEQFRRVNEQASGTNRVVKSVLVKSDGKEVHFDYLLKQIKGRWRILNISVDGVSDLATKQAEYGSIMSRGGFASLLSTLRRQTQGYASGNKD